MATFIMVRITNKSVIIKITMPKDNFFNTNRRSCYSYRNNRWINLNKIDFPRIDGGDTNLSREHYESLNRKIVRNFKKGCVTSSITCDHVKTFSFLFSNEKAQTLAKFKALFSICICFLCPSLFFV